MPKVAPPWGPVDPAAGEVPGSEDMAPNACALTLIYIAAALDACPQRRQYIRRLHSKGSSEVIKPADSALCACALPLH
jgi:hypothetical protein